MRFSLAGFLPLCLSVCLCLAHCSPAAPDPADPAAAPSSAEAVDLAVENALLLTMDSARHRYAEGTLLVREGAIVAVGPSSALRGQYRASETLDAQGYLLMPGLVNTHTHAAMTLFRGLADDLPLQQWLEEFVWPAEAQFIDSSTVRLGTQLALTEMIRGGITAYCDMYFFAEVVAEETRRAGLRGLIGEGLLRYPTPSAATPDQALARSRRFIEAWQGDALVTPVVAPHSPYACDEQLLRQAQEMADHYDLPLTIHLAETERERRALLAEKGLSPTAYLDQLNLLRPGLIAAHGVALSPADVALLQRRGGGVAHCPESNLKLASGIAPWQDLHQAGITVGLGTDGATSNNNLNLFEEMNLAAKLQKVATQDPAALPAEDVVAMATIEGARLLGLDDRTGSLEVGKRADFILLDLQQPHLTPLYNPYSQLVYAAQASDVQHVMVAGRWLMRNRQLLTLNEARIRTEVKEVAAQIRAQVLDQP